MIVHLRHSDIDRRKWDECVAHSRCGLVYVRSWYLDVVCPGWEALVDGDYVSVMPLTWRKRFGIRYLCQPFFVQKTGVFSRNELTKSQMEAFVGAAKDVFSFAEINIVDERDFLADLPRHRNYELSLEADYSGIVANYHENTRRNLSRAGKNGLVVSDVSDIDKVIALFDTDRRPSLPSFDVRSYDVLRALSGKALDRGEAFIKGVSFDGSDDLLAAAFFVNDGRRVTFLFSGNSAEGKRVQAMTLLIDTVIREYSGSKMILDFEGSDDDGLARFYAGFGSAQSWYKSLRFNNMSWFSNFVLSVWKKFR